MWEIHTASIHLAVYFISIPISISSGQNPRNEQWSSCYGRSCCVLVDYSSKVAFRSNA